MWSLHLSLVVAICHCARSFLYYWLHSLCCVLHLCGLFLTKSLYSNLFIYNNKDGPTGYYGKWNKKGPSKCCLSLISIIVHLTSPCEPYKITLSCHHSNKLVFIAVTLWNHGVGSVTPLFDFQQHCKQSITPFSSRASSLGFRVATPLWFSLDLTSLASHFYCWYVWFPPHSLSSSPGTPPLGIFPLWLC